MSASHKKLEIDELLGKVWSAQSNILPELDFLHSVFSFLNRRSVYLAESGNSKKVLQLVNKYIDEAKDMKIQKEREQEKEKEQEKKLEQTNKANDKKIPIENVPKSNEISTQSEPIQTRNSDNIFQSNVVNTSNNDNEKKDDKSQLQAPVSNGGVTDNYVWTQTLHDVDVRISIPINLKGKDLKVEIGKRKLLAGIKGKPPIINGELHDAVVADDCSWTLDEEHGKKNKTLTLSLKKENGMSWWRRVIVGDLEIDTSKIEPENSQLQDLDPETRQTVEKMMTEQRQKMMGIPTQKELEQQQMVEKLKKQFPNMDFSQTKFA